MDHLVNVVCGGFAGFVADALLYPLDTLKTRSQLTRNLQVERRHMQRLPRYRSLYTGFFVLALGDVPSSAVFYGIYEFTKEVLSDRNISEFPLELRHAVAGLGDEGTKLPLPLVHLAGSSCGQFCSLLIRNPFEVIKQQMQAGLHPTSYATFQSIRRAQGYRGLYAGFFPTLMREVPFDGIQFMLWERLKTLESAKSSVLRIWPMGGCAGIATVPLDVVKTRLMTQGSSRMYSSATDCVCRIVREEGLRALFSGMWIRTAWITLGGFIFFASLELGKLKVRPLFRPGEDASLPQAPRAHAA
ncbi:-Mitochondrial substrate carrier family protein W [Babesia bigemina]|uniref:-Mitochondrial substrate carrier family protein W n=1 Tax=Babesia bigemina TaxID=5866 RepID=A0A061DCS4_BABBI|nr:-Mitochondrial substrate carrier family protein W [Babesia bigemina]CDR97972.1 -Mitochondrial substrate carrier family protein W [Babesia bigemina]|eukprot:XP_012770158.1 -Mitochondrial substrate carrier family protein W [Babesia bigemina]